MITAGGRRAPLEARFCRDVTRRAATSFYYAFRVLSPSQRDALYAVYAFCRAVDDAADENDPREAPRLLAGWREELARCYRGAPLHPVTVVLAAALERYPVPKASLEAVIDGMEMDLAVTRYATFAELETYCRCVASAVGRASIEIFGYRNPATREYADALGVALQLTNILRDLHEDAARDRLYLPLEDLERFGVPAEDLLRGVYNRAFRELMAFEVSRAREWYRRAERALTPEDAAALRAAEIMRGTYAGLLERIEGSGYFVFGPRVGIPRGRKIALAARLWIGSWLPAAA